MSATLAAYGRLGKDPEPRTSKAGKPWATASMAIADDEAAIWIGVVAFGQVAETLCKHTKGDPLSVVGRLQMNKWTDREGRPRESLQVVADAIVSARTVRPDGRKPRDPEPQKRWAL